MKQQIGEREKQRRAMREARARELEGRPVVRTTAASVRRVAGEVSADERERALVGGEAVALAASASGGKPPGGRVSVGAASGPRPVPVTFSLLQSEIDWIDGEMHRRRLRSRSETLRAILAGARGR